MKTIKSQHNETLDAVAYRVYNDNAMLPAVINANRQLASFPVILPVGTTVNLPDRTPVKKRRTLWEADNE